MSLFFTRGACGVAPAIRRSNAQLFKTVERSQLCVAAPLGQQRASSSLRTETTAVGEKANSLDNIRSEINQLHAEITALKADVKRMAHMIALPAPVWRVVILETIWTKLTPTPKTTPKKTQARIMKLLEKAADQTLAKMLNVPGHQSLQWKKFVCRVVRRMPVTKRDRDVQVFPGQLLSSALYSVREEPLAGESDLAEGVQLLLLLMGRSEIESALKAIRESNTLVTPSEAQIQDIYSYLDDTNCK